MTHQLKHASVLAISDGGEASWAHESPTCRDRQSLVVPRVVQPVGPGQAATSSVSDVLVHGLISLGAPMAFGLFGGGIAPFYKAMSASSLEMIVCRTEGGAAFSAIEASLANGKLIVVASTTGPGVTNLFTGMVAARWEGARIVFVSGCTRPPQRGRWAFQETGGGSNPMQPLYASGSLFHYATMIEDPAEIETALTRIATGLTNPNGFVAHIGLPINIQSAPATRSFAPLVSVEPHAQCSASSMSAIVDALASEPFAIWAGFGARESAEVLTEFAELAQAPVMCSPRAKGVFPERHPLYLGVTGLGGTDRAEEYMNRARPNRLLVLGSRLGEMTSFWSETLIPPGGLIHVDVEKNVFGAAYPTATTLGVVAEVGSFLRQLVAAWPKAQVTRNPLPKPSSHDAPQLLPRTGRVRPSFLMQVIQTVVVENSDALVLTEAGNSFALGSHYLHLAEAKRYRVSTGFGSMGHAAAGVLGAALGSGRKAVAIVGDGSLLMLNEMSTAANYAIDAVWIVLNDSRYGMIAQGMESLGWTPFETDFPEADFVAIAEAVGAKGIRVDSELALESAMVTAMATPGPFVVDVIIDRDEQAPSGKRNQSLLQQTSTTRVPR